MVNSKSENRYFHAEVTRKRVDIGGNKGMQIPPRPIA